MMKKEQIEAEIKALQIEEKAGQELVQAIETMAKFSITGIAEASQGIHSYYLNRIIQGLMIEVKRRKNDARIALVIRELAEQYY